MDFGAISIGQRVRQYDWMLPPNRYRDGVITKILEPATGTEHGWVLVSFDPQSYNPQRHTLRCSSAQLEPLGNQP